VEKMFYHAIAYNLIVKDTYIN